jgi:hypothetical protein
VVVDGAETSAAGVLEGVIEGLGTEVKEAANGEMRETILGAYCFAF